MCVFADIHIGALRAGALSRLLTWKKERRPRPAGVETFID
jgi:hypothetical protein